MWREWGWEGEKGKKILATYGPVPITMLTTVIANCCSNVRDDGARTHSGQEAKLSPGEPTVLPRSYFGGHVTSSIT